MLTLGDVNAGNGTCITRKHGGCPLVTLEELVWREYCSLDGVARGLHVRGVPVASFLCIENEHGTSLTCSRCYSPVRLKQGKRWRCKTCREGGIESFQLPQQQHVGVPLSLDRDVNSARLIEAKFLAESLFGGGWLVHPGQLSRLRVCTDRHVRKAWLQQQKAAAAAAAAAAAGVGGA